MTEIEVFLKKEIGADLGSRQKIEKLFKNIEPHVSMVIMNFECVEFILRMRQYLDF